MLVDVLYKVNDKKNKYYMLCIKDIEGYRLNKKKFFSFFIICNSEILNLKNF